MSLSNHQSITNNNKPPLAPSPQPALTPRELENKLTDMFERFDAHPEFGNEFCEQALRPHVHLSRVLEIFKDLPELLAMPTQPGRFKVSSKRSGELLLESLELLKASRAETRGLLNERIWGPELANFGRQLSELVEKFVLTQNDFTRQRNAIVEKVRSGEINWHRIEANAQSTDPDVLADVLNAYGLAEGYIVRTANKKGHMLVRGVDGLSTLDLSIRQYLKPRFRGIDFGWSKRGIPPGLHLSCKNGDRIVFSKYDSSGGAQVQAWCWLQDFLAAYRESGASIIGISLDDLNDKKVGE